MAEDIHNAVIDAIRRLDTAATDIAIQDDLSPLAEERTTPLSLTWKSNDELHIGNFVAWSRPEPVAERELTLLKALDQVEIAVPSPVTSGSSGGTTITLAHPFDGEPMSSSLTTAGMRWEISATAFTYARTLARIHALDWAKTAPWMEDPESVPEDIIDDQVEREFEWREAQRDTVPAEWGDYVRRVIDWLELRRPVEVSLCICHGRFWPGNIYAVGEDITVIADWRDARVTDASYDLAMLPVWLNDIGLSAEEVELFAQAAHGAYLQASPRGLGNLPYYSVALPFDQLLARLLNGQTSNEVLESLKGTIERAMVLGGRVPWKSR